MLLTLSDKISIAGTLVSVGGAVYAAVKAGKASRAAQGAVVAVEGALFLADTAAAVKTVEEIQGYLRVAEWDKARMRLHDLLATMRQARSSPAISLNDERLHVMEGQLTALGLLRKSLEKRLADDGAKIDVPTSCERLSAASDFLNDVLAVEKVRVGNERRS